LIKSFNHNGATDENGAPIHDVEVALRRGLVKCFQANGCTSRFPELDPFSRYVLQFFLDTSHLMRRDGFSGDLARADRLELRQEADGRGITWSEALLDKYAVCESARMEADVTIRKRNTPSK